MGSNWTPVTMPDEDTAKRDEAKAERDAGCAPFDFVMSPADRFAATTAQLDVLAMRRRADFSNTPRGLVVNELSATELTDDERRAFGIEDSVRHPMFPDIPLTPLAPGATLSYRSNEKLPETTWRQLEPDSGASKSGGAE